MIPTSKTALVTHKNCLDGTGCATLFVWAGGNIKNVFFRDPKGCALTPEEAAPFDHVLFADVCPWDLTDPAGGKPWTVIDHHDTNIRRHKIQTQGMILSNGHGAMCFDTSKCATSLLAQHLTWHRNLADLRGWDMVSAIEAYDLGRFDDHDGVMIADLASCRSQLEMWELLHENGGYVVVDSDFQNEAAGVTRVRRKFAENAAQHAFVVPFSHGDDVYRLGLTSSPRDFANETAQRILIHDYAGGRVDIAVCFDITRNSASLRSLEGGPNVAKIAEEYGGGGHPRAAGIRLDPKMAYQLIFEGIFG